MTDSPWQYFTMEELTCPCCGVMAMDTHMMPKLVSMRRYLGFPLPISSGYRCPRHNADVSHTGVNGPHTYGRAVDISIRGNHAFAVVTAAQGYGFTGIGVSQKGELRFIHLDDIPPSDLIHPRPWIWSYP